MVTATHSIVNLWEVSRAYRALSENGGWMFPADVAKVTGLTLEKAITAINMMVAAQDVQVQSDYYGWTYKATAHKWED